MVESIFVNSAQLKGLESSGANHLIVFEKGLDSAIWDKLKIFNMDLSICIGAFGADGCPANPLTQEKLFQKIQNVLTFQPKEIWIDHFRFDGYWEGVKEGHIPNTHQDCEFCEGKNRVSVLNEVTHKVMNLVGGKSQVGYFSVPFKSEETPELITKLGQDHSIIGKIFDMSSPMLYQQMINKPTSYISEYVQWLFKQTQKPVLPILDPII